jgi:hypothetical protein
MPFHVVFYTVVIVTLLSGVTATALVALGRGRRIPYKRALVERLSQIALLGAAALFALLARLPA